MADVQRVVVGPTNCYLVRGQGGVVLVDPGPPRGERTVLAGMRAKGVGPSEVKLILVTHGHFDHVGCAAAVQQVCGAPIALHRLEPDYYGRSRFHAMPPAQTLRGELLRWGYLLWSLATRLEMPTPDLLLDDGADLSPYGVDGSVVLSPGHTPGSVSVWLPDGRALVGDVLVNVGLPSEPMFADDRAALRRSLDALRARGTTTAYVGHGEPLNLAATERIHPGRYQLRWWVR